MWSVATGTATSRLPTASMNSPRPSLRNRCLSCLEKLLSKLGESTVETGRNCRLKSFAAPATNIYAPRHKYLERGAQLFTAAAMNRFSILYFDSRLSANCSSSGSSAAFMRERMVTIGSTISQSFRDSIMPRIVLPAVGAQLPFSMMPKRRF